MVYKTGFPTKNLRNHLFTKWKIHFFGLAFVKCPKLWHWNFSFICLINMDIHFISWHTVFHCSGLLCGLDQLMRDICWNKWMMSLILLGLVAQLKIHEKKPCECLRALTELFWGFPVRLVAAKVQPTCHRHTHTTHVKLTLCNCCYLSTEMGMGKESGPPVMAGDLATIGARLLAEFWSGFYILSRSVPHKAASVFRLMERERVKEDVQIWQLHTEQSATYRNL